MSRTVDTEPLVYTVKEGYVHPMLQNDGAVSIWTSAYGGGRKGELRLHFRYAPPGAGAHGQKLPVRLLEKTTVRVLNLDGTY